jgi:poly(3-hydroxyalkanoate) synthetase
MAGKLENLQYSIYCSLRPNAPRGDWDGQSENEGHIGSLLNPPLLKGPCHEILRLPAFDLIHWLKRQVHEILYWPFYGFSMHLVHTRSQKTQEL